ncbi:uncharacterized protein LOC128801605 isoform X1 [Vidua chalybeata]|uniref:uncharacterized protein LOC128801605 isoform X1 n=1 Tax=Vidua chalybeata TaxID=81927 RepID=UPI0023A7C678|nr:uncharacterized protein LOC128801605 isoform X1 [Vidua chalybeata]XP_053823595.1 uncharacterized protein LOC128801605 isoform X1 [Vidua chalybeata]
MGGKLSTQQKEIYYQVKVTLTESGKSFSKSFVNKFIKWLILRFPNVSAQDVRKMGFWKHVGAVLTEGTKKGDPSVKKGFMRIFLLVYDMVKEGADSRETREAEKSPSALFPPSPRPPRSENANRCVETSVSNPSSDSFHSCGCSQKCCTPSNPFPRPPRDEPPQDGGGRVAGVFVSSQDGQRSTAETPPSQVPPHTPVPDPPSLCPDPSSSSLAADQTPPRCCCRPPPTAPPLQVVPSAPPLEFAPPDPALLHTASPTSATPTQTSTPEPPDPAPRLLFPKLRPLVPMATGKAGRPKLRNRKQARIQTPCFSRQCCTTREGKTPDGNHFHTNA